MENERKRTPSGYVWNSCPLKFDLRSNGSKLEREFDHALDDLDNHKSHNDRRDSFNDQYDNEEERRVIEGSETEPARKLHQGIRYDHYGTAYIVKDQYYLI